MMAFSTSLLNCLCGSDDAHPDHHHDPHHNYTLIAEKTPLEPLPSTTHHATSTDANCSNPKLTTQTTKILTIILHSPPPNPGTDLTPLITTEVSTANWTSILAERVLHALEDTLRSAAKSADRSAWGGALTDAYNRAVELAGEELRALWDYAKEHPYEVAAEVLLTVLALGVLARLVPAFVRVLGFGRLGPVEGSFAAWWQSLYRGYVPKESVWSFLQRMGMVWE